MIIILMVVQHYTSSLAQCFITGWLWRECNMNHTWGALVPVQPLACHTEVG